MIANTAYFQLIKSNPMVLRPELTPTFAVRRTVLSLLLLFANIGAVQLNYSVARGGLGRSEIEAMVHGGASEADLTAAARRDGPGLVADGLRQIRAGITTVADVARVAQEV